jgi:cobalt-zinc-cadmium efflux system membrane fusion protein
MTMNSIPKKGLVAITIIVAILFGLRLSACSEPPAEGAHTEGAEAGEAERGPHGGRLLRDGDFALELTIFEDGVDPQFRLFSYRNDQPLPPSEVTASVTLNRLGGATDRFAFTPEADYLKGDGVVTEPHSFDVTVNATHDGANHQWAYDSYEGRTTIAADAAAEAGVKTAAAGAASINETVDLSGRITLAPSGRAEIKAWFAGRIVSLKVNVGDRVKRGDTIATVEASDSLRTYSIPAPIDGVVIERALNVGDVASDAPIAVIGNPAAVQAEFHVFPGDAERVREGQKVTVRSLNGLLTASSVIDTFLPVAEAATQTLTARAKIPNPDEAWRPGAAVEGQVTVSTIDVPLAVRVSALQRFRDFTVVFAQVGDVYEVRMLELGRRDSEWVEVLGGLAPGEIYVTDNAFLIRADIEKSGASHDH